ncbi:LuxR family transcriptional regulator [Kitasatospora sp. MBT66]|uniref:helix-turn-helix transcriptional regulator n=1 Tax=Kitasatospora sp. MBT66 TaxID=1444769 RepID=UPI0005B9C4F7|nr:LuxR family transcriptional regulator [Kitasatospora sp. MBT66]
MGTTDGIDEAPWWHEGGAPLVGRDGELDLVAVWSARAFPAGGLLVVTGEPGIGRTALLREAARRAERSGAVTAWVGAPGDRRPAGEAGVYWAKAAARAVRTAAGHAGADHLGAGDGREPDGIGTAPSPAGLARALAAEADRLRAERPLLLVVDDAHRLAPQALAVLHHLGSAAAPGLAVLCAARADTPAARPPQGDTLRLGPLDAPTAARLLDTRFPGLSRRRRQEIAEAAGGLPLALVEAAAEEQHAGPGEQPDGGAADPTPRIGPRLRRIHAERLRRLGPESRAVLLAAACEPDPDLDELLVAAAALHGGPVPGAALDAVVRAGLLVLPHEGGGVRFRRRPDAVATLEAAGHRRAAAHAAWARILADRPERALLHRATSAPGPDEALARALEERHRSAVAVGTPVPDTALLDLAARLSADGGDRGRRHLLAAEHARALGRPGLTRHHLAAAAAERLTAADRTALHWLRATATGCPPPSPSTVGRLCADARRLAPDAADRAARLLLLAARLCHRGALGPAPAAEVLAALDALPPGGSDSSDYSDCFDCSGCCDCSSCSDCSDEAGRADGAGSITAARTAILALLAPAAAAGPLRRALERFEAAPDPHPVAHALMLAEAAHALGEHTRAEEIDTRCLPHLHALGLHGLLPALHARRAAVATVRGDAEAVRQAAAALADCAEDTGRTAWGAPATAFEAMSAGLAGDPERARTAAERAGAEALRTGRVDVLAVSVAARAAAAVGEGRHLAAYERLRRLFDPGDPAHHPAVALDLVAPFADAARRSDHRPEARRLLRRAEQYAHPRPAPAARLQLAYAEAVLAPGEGRAVPTGVLGSGELAGWPQLYALVHLAHGSALRRARRPAAARTSLRAAMEVFTALGQRRRALDVAAELRATGERPARPGHTGPERPRLSPQERRIADLAALGLSNREIGRQLDLSPRTVGSHLYRLFPKLGITGRAQIVHRLPTVAGQTVAEPAVALLEVS